ncbi:MAG: hypothetical protein OXE99_12125 [Cellvibrionales bacterium]|nr:hypothetical protein [Cellvibrionales bacterium]
MITVIGSIGFLVLLSFFKAPILLSIVLASILAGQLADLTVIETISSFNEGIKNGATIALNYGCIGAFAAGLAKSGVTSWACEHLAESHLIKQATQPKFIILLIILLASISSQNIIPIHIAFIPLIIPVMLHLMSQYQLDRRAVTCCVCFGLVVPYMTIPIGFGKIYINDVLFNNLHIFGIDTPELSIVKAMWIPALGMLFGLFIATFINYKKPRQYQHSEKLSKKIHTHIRPRKRTIVATLCILTITLALQIFTNSMVIGALIGFSLFTITGIINLKDSDDVFLLGIKMMANIAFIMIAAQGFAQVLSDSGQILPMIKTLGSTLTQHRNIGIFAILLAGLLITVGIGSSFSTVPIIASVFVPLALEMKLEPLSIITLIGTAGALGDACSPVSETTLAPSMALNADGQHDHFKDTIIPCFFHITLPLLISGWVAVVFMNR